MGVETLSGIAAIVLSLAFSYVPGLAPWYDPLPSDKKQLIMVGVLFVVALGSVGLACTGLAADFGLTVTCDRVGVLAVVQAFIAALVANQAAYALTRKNPTVG